MGEPGGGGGVVPFGESDFIFQVIVSITGDWVGGDFEFWFHGDGEGGGVGGIG